VNRKPTAKNLSCNSPAWRGRFLRTSPEFLDLRFADSESQPGDGVRALRPTRRAFAHDHKPLQSSTILPDLPDFISSIASSATTTFVGGMPVIRVPASGLAGNTFLSALSYSVPVTINVPGGLKHISWSGVFTSDTPGVSVRWKWAAAVYTNFSADYKRARSKTGG